MTKKEAAMDYFWLDPEKFLIHWDDVKDVFEPAKFEPETEDDSDVTYADENPLGVAWNEYYKIMQAKDELRQQGYTALLGREENEWCFRVYGMPYPEESINGVNVYSIETIVPKVVK